MKRAKCLALLVLLGLSVATAQAETWFTCKGNYEGVCAE